MDKLFTQMVQHDVDHYETLWISNDEDAYDGEHQFFDWVDRQIAMEDALDA